MRLTALLAIGLAFVQVGDARAAWTWPVDGELATTYSYHGDRFAPGQHRGIDVAAPTGAPVVAAASGTVRFAGSAGSSGLTVSIRTADGRFDTSYLHLADALVLPGDAVRAGQRIGAVGATGRRSIERPHLHFGVRAAGTRDGYRDPLGLLAQPPRGDLPRGGPAPVGRPVRLWPVARPRPHGVPAVGLNHGWALACVALILVAVLVGRSSIGPSCRTTSQPRSTTSTASPTWATSTQRSPPTSSRATCASVATTSSS